MNDKEYYIREMRKCNCEDTELGHVHADKLLCDLVKKYCPFGEEIVNEFDSMYKWYA